MTRTNARRTVTDYGLPPDHPPVWRILVDGGHALYSLTEPRLDNAREVNGTGTLGLHFDPVPDDTFPPGSIATSRTYAVVTPGFPSRTVLVDVLYIPARRAAPHPPTDHHRRGNLTHPPHTLTRRRDETDAP